MTDREHLNLISKAVKALDIGGTETDVLLRIREILEKAGYKF